MLRIYLTNIFLNIGKLFSNERLMTVISALVVLGVSLLISHVLTKVMKENGFTQKPKVNYILTSFASIAMFITFGLSVTLIQGMFLFFVLLYASISDITSHTVDDSVWIVVFASALLNIQTIGLRSMTFAGLAVLIPQLALAILPPHKTLGGADIKLSVALAFLLGFSRGFGTYLVSLIVATAFMSLYNRKKRIKTDKPFPLVPFLSGTAMLAFLI